MTTIIDNDAINSVNHKFTDMQPQAHGNASCDELEET